MSDGKIDVSQSRLVPKHEVVPKDAEQKLLAQLGITKHGLPKIHDTDPQVKRIGAKEGSIVKITRAGNFETMPNMYYRIVARQLK